MRDIGDGKHHGGAARRRFIKHVVAGAAALVLPRVRGAAAMTAGREDLLIRTVTAGVRVERSRAGTTVEEATRFLARARAMLEGEGYMVQTTRVATQPHGEYMAGVDRAARAALVEELHAPLGENQMLAIGPAPAEEESAVDTAVAAAMRDTCITIVTGDAEGGVRPGGIAAAAEVITRLAATAAAQNMYFAAVASLPAGIPFFPGGYHGGREPSFAIGPQSAKLVARVCNEVGRLDTVAAPLVEEYGRALAEVEAIARRIERETGWRYTGIDPTPAPFGDHSIAAAVEALTGAPFGAPGTLAACRVLTETIRAVPVLRTGYQGLFLPPLEDAVLARRAYEHYGLSTLLACSAVCGTGLDTVVLPGDVSAAELRRILYDVASLAVKLGKPLTARLIPVPGVAAGEQVAPVPDMAAMRALAVR